MSFWTQPRTQNLAAAVGLAVLTLAVFASAQSMGPESVVRRYHEALVRGNEAELRRLVVEQPGDPYDGELRYMLVRYLNSAESFQIERSDTRGKEAIVDVEYSFGKRGKIVKPFILQRSGSMWRISATASQLRLRQSLGFE